MGRLRDALLEAPAVLDAIEATSNAILLHQAQVAVARARIETGALKEARALAETALEGAQAAANPAIFVEVAAVASLVRITDGAREDARPLLLQVIEEPEALAAATSFLPSLTRAAVLLHDINSQTRSARELGRCTLQTWRRSRHPGPRWKKRAENSASPQTPTSRRLSSWPPSEPALNTPMPSSARDDASPR